MNGESREGYARLPEDLLQELLVGAESVVAQVTSFLGSALDRKEELRTWLLELNLIRTYARTAAQTICGVDGGFALERTSAVDLLLAVAVGVEGLSEGTTPWKDTQYLWWSRVSRHDSDAERLARGVMVGQELAILGDAPHGLRILDGSHLTLVIQLNSALSSFSDSIRVEAIRVWRELGTKDALAQAVSSRAIIGMPKYDSSRVICELLAQASGKEIPGDDKYLLSLLLEPGELLVPQQVPLHPWSALHFTAPLGATRSQGQYREELMEVIQPLRDRALNFTYFKPDEFSPAYRMELKSDMREADLDAACSTIASQITGPFVREPFPQYLADVMAKSVGLGLGALKTAVQLGLSRMDRPDIAELLVQSYRTEGV
jgi:hypothetical protein